MKTSQKFLKEMFGILWTNRKRTSLIREQTKVEDILNTIIRKKWTWAGHNMIQGNNRWTVRVREW